MRAGLLALALVSAACTPPASSPATSPPAAAATAGTTQVPTATPGAAGTASPQPAASASPAAITMREFPVPAGSGPHDVAPAADGGVWFTAQRSGHLGWLDPRTGQTRMIALGAGSAPHGVIVDDAGVAWVTDGGLNAIVSVDPRANDKVTVHRLPSDRVNLNTAAFDIRGDLWFTGQSGYFGRVALSRAGGAPAVEVSRAPRGSGPYGITAQPRTSGLQGVYYASLAGHHIAEIIEIPTEGSGPAGFAARPIDPPTAGAGPRRVWSDSKGLIWVSEWNAGQVARYDPYKHEWAEWKLPGDRPQAYAVFVDDRDVVWLSDFGSSSIVRFDPATETFRSFPYRSGGAVRQIHGRPGEVWGALSSFDKLIVLYTGG